MLPKLPPTPANDFGALNTQADPQAHVQGHAARVQMGRPDRRLTPKEAHLLWKTVYAAEHFSDDARESYRIVLAWRMTREIAERSGHLKREEPLCTITQEWHSLTTGKKKVNTDLPMEQWALAGLLSRKPGIPLHPKFADPEELERFELAMELLAEELNLEEGCTAVPDLGYHGLPGLIQLWPSQEKILRYEEDLIEAVQTQIEHMGQARVAKYIQSVTGLRPRAARSFARVAQWQLREDTSMDPELARSIHIQQLEQLIHRAQQDGNHAAELRAHNQLIQLRGLLKTVGDTTLDDMQAFIEEMSAEDEQTEGVAPSDPDPTDEA